MAAETFMVGNTKAFTYAPTLDGAVWNLTGATVTFYLLSPTPGAVPISFSATVQPGGLSAVYTCTTSDLSVPGVWYRWWNAVLSGVQETMPAVQFNVQAVP